MNCCAERALEHVVIECISKQYLLCDYHMNTGKKGKGHGNGILI